MSLQAIRWVFEQPVLTAMGNEGVPLLLDNSATVENDALDEYAVLRIDFGRVTEDALQIPLERIRGSIVFGVYTEKNKGPGRSQVLATAALRALNGVGVCGCRPKCGAWGRTMNMSGPSFFSLDDRPYFYSSLNCGFDAQWRDPADCS